MARVITNSASSSSENSALLQSDGCGAVLFGSGCSQTACRDLVAWRGGVVASFLVTRVPKRREAMLLEIDAALLFTVAIPLMLPKMTQKVMSTESWHGFL